MKEVKIIPYNRKLKNQKNSRRLEEEDVIYGDFQDGKVTESETNTIKTAFNTMFIEQKPQSFKLISLEDMAEDFYVKQNAYKVYKIFLGEFDDEGASNGTGNHAILNKLQLGNPLEDIVELHISSPGGDYLELVQLYNILNSMYSDNVTTFLNYGYSAGALAFLFGNSRIVYEHSDFMIHSYSSGFFGKRDDLIKKMLHADRHITAFFNKMLEPYFSKEEIQNIHSGNDFWLNSNEMIERNIATGIIIEGKYYTREEYLEILNPPKPKVEKKAKPKAKPKDKPKDKPKAEKKGE